MNDICAQRDRFAALLSLAERLADEAPEAQIVADNGEIVDGRWLSATIHDALWEGSSGPAGDDDNP